MPHQRFGTLRKVVLSTITAVSLILATVSSALASSGGANFP